MNRGRPAVTTADSNILLRLKTILSTQLKRLKELLTILIDNEGADLPKAVPRKRTKFEGDDELAVVPSNKGFSLNLDNNRIP